MTYKPGQKLYSAASEVEVVVTRPAASDIVLECHGVAMLESNVGRTIKSGALMLTIGKRYQHEPSNLEVLVVKGGAGPLTIDGSELTMKAAKALPSSD